MLRNSERDQSESRQDLGSLEPGTSTNVLRVLQELTSRRSLKDHVKETQMWDFLAMGLW